MFLVGDEDAILIGLFKENRLFGGGEFCPKRETILFEDEGGLSFEAIDFEEELLAFFGHDVDSAFVGVEGGEIGGEVGRINFLDEHSFSFVKEEVEGVKKYARDAQIAQPARSLVQKALNLGRAKGAILLCRQKEAIR